MQDFTTNRWTKKEFVNSYMGKFIPSDMACSSADYLYINELLDGSQ